ncbi:glycosyltransferase family 4 protein [Microbacterium marinilacus]|uniref:Glycosyl transferase family 1 domain-containing protein n=1 Tax=Microbacterium marinilacus TaxID=415209 RepID=A0ABP7BDY3_9MICO|nr:glycosyltransferase family 4 protein [Microbacterium marinilacus]MBY0689430.1 glycosyltransferase family 4 protein [Microbacterium marinilacus]
MSQGIKVAVLTALFPPAYRGGGPIRSAEAMVAAAPVKYRPVVLTGDRDLGSSEPLPVETNRWTDHDGFPVYYVNTRSIGALVRAFRSVRRERPEILHFNSFFDPRLTIVPIMMWRLGFWGRPTLLLAPRGEFGRGAIQRRAVKKRLYMALFRLLRIDRAVTWHSTADHETEDIRREWGADARIVLRENHTLLPREPLAPAVPSGDVVRLTFVGRIVEHKGLAVAIEAASDSGPLILDVYGATEDKQYADHCESLAKSVAENVTVTFKGLVDAGEVRQVLSGYDGLLMPTAGENFGHVIAEALSASCPVVVTPYTPWTETLESAGIIVPDRDPSSWTAAIKRLSAMSPAQRSALRQNAADAYRMWRARESAPHVWDMVAR